MATIPDCRYTEDGTMTTTMAIPSKTAANYLPHFFDRTLDDDRYVVKRLQAMAEATFGVAPATSQRPRGRAGARRNAKRVIVNLPAVKKMRPAPNKIIMCIALNHKCSGV